MAVLPLGKNIASDRAVRLLNESSDKLSRLFERLSTGVRINRASDDPAGLALASSLNVDGAIYSQSIKNFNLGISYLSIAERALSELTSVTIRLQELASQASNGVFQAAERQAFDKEADALVDEYNRILATTKFNGDAIFGSSTGELRLQGGIGQDASIAFTPGENLATTPGTPGSYLLSAGIVPGGNGWAGTGDFDGDGNQDIAVQEGGNVRVSYGDGNGGFAAVQQVIGLAGQGDYVAADINGDGITDLARARSALIPFFGGYQHSLGVAEGQAGRTFNSYFTGTYVGAGTVGPATGVVVADFHPAYAGLEAVILTDDQIVVPSDFGSPTPDYIAVAFAGANTVGIARDFNGDGNADLVAGSDDGTFQFGTSPIDFNVIASGPIPIGSGTIVSLGMGYFNLDGELDVAAVDSTGDLNVLVTDTFSYAPFATGFDPLAATRLAIADLDGNGLDDIVVGDGNSVTILHSNGTGFENTQYSTGGANIRGLATADFNEDGVLDVVIADTNVDVLLSQPGTAQSFELDQQDLTTANSARLAITVFEGLLDNLAAERGVIGAVQSRLQAAVGALQSTELNYRTAHSRIVDIDVAEEAASLLRTQIIREAGTAVLAQANQQPALVLQILSES